MDKPKTIFAIIEQKNRLMSYVFGPNANKASDRQKARILKALFNG